MTYDNKGFENGDVGGIGHATAWGLNAKASVETAAAYFGDGGNLLSLSDELDNVSSWTVLGGGSIARPTSPPTDGPPGLGVTVWELTDAVAAASHGILQTILSIPGVPTEHEVVASVWARKEGTPNFLAITIETVEAWFNLDLGVVGTVNNAEDSAATIEDYGDGWYRCSVRARRDGAFNAGFRVADTDGVLTYTGTGALVLSLYGAQVNVGSALTPFIVTSASSYTAGVKGVEDFESLWDANEGYLHTLAEAGSAAADYPSLISPFTKAHDDFEEEWSNSGYLIALGPTTVASYGEDADNFEDFESGWFGSQAAEDALLAITGVSLYDFDAANLTLNGSDVEGFADLSANSRDFVAGTTGTDAQYSATGGINGRPAVDYNGTNQWQNGDGWSEPAGSLTFGFGLNVQSTATNAVMQTQSGTIICFVQFGSSGMGFRDSSGDSFFGVQPVTGEQTLVFRAEAGADVTLFRNGIVAGTPQPYTATLVGGLIGMGGIFGLGVTPFDGLIWRALIADVALSDAQAATAHAWLSGLGGVYYADWAAVVAGPGAAAADYDPGGPTQSYEDFGDADATLWNDGGTYHLTLASAGSTAASYDVSTPENFEDFEEEWPTVVMVTV